MNNVLIIEIQNGEVIDIALRPYPNEHAARLQDPDKFDSFRRTNGSTHLDIPKTIAIIWGHIKGSEANAFEMQSLRFPVKNWTVAQARKWLKDNDYKPIEFEEASGKESAGGVPVFKFIDLVIVKAESEDKPLTPLPIQVEDVTNMERVIRFKASDDTIDHYDEVILAEGWLFDLFLKNNPIMQFHDYNAWPLGKGIAVGVIDNALFIDCEFDPPEVDESADLVFRKINHGTIKAGSVGFIPLKWVTPGSKKGQDVDDLFLKYPKARRIFLEQKLLEFSICPIPANPNALAASMLARYAKLTGRDIKDLQTDFQGSDTTNAATESEPDLTAAMLKMYNIQKRIESL